MKVLDLCSGLGGFSEAFLAAGHDVLRIENNPLLSDVPATREMCIFEFRDWLEDHYQNPETIGSMFMSARFHNIDLILFSPPCHEFSLAYNAPKAIHLRENPGIPYEPDLSILDCGMDIIEILKPRYHIIENVRGASPHFSELLGKARQINDAYFFWGNFPSFSPAAFPSKAEKDERHSPLRANIRGKVPIQISEALLDAVTNQRSILDFVDGL